MWSCDICRLDPGGARGQWAKPATPRYQGLAEDRSGPNDRIKTEETKSKAHDCVQKGQTRHTEVFTDFIEH